MTTNGPFLAGEEMACGLAAARRSRGLSARKLAEECASVGWHGLDRQRIANLEAGRGRGLTVEELMVLGWVLRLSLSELMVSPWPDTTSATEADLVAEWQLGDIRVTREVHVARGSLPFWFEGSHSPWSEPPVHAGPPPAPRARSELMEWIADLADDHGLRVIFEPLDGGPRG